MKEEQKRTMHKGRSRLSSKSVALMRKSRLWVKTDRRLILNGIVQTLSNGDRVVLRDDDAAQALIREWRPTFANATGDKEANLSFLATPRVQEVLRKWKWRDTPPPTEDSVERALRKLASKTTRVGRDGVPYLA
eukprot:8339414-Karenia_brevis.AAC.1